MNTNPQKIINSLIQLSQALGSDYGLYKSVDELITTEGRKAITKQTSESLKNVISLIDQDLEG